MNRWPRVRYPLIMLSTLISFRKCSEPSSPCSSYRPFRLAAEVETFKKFLPSKVDRCGVLGISFVKRIYVCSVATVNII